jgi:hypothetical protein
LVQYPRGGYSGFISCSSNATARYFRHVLVSAVVIRIIPVKTPSGYLRRFGEIKRNPEKVHLLYLNGIQIDGRSEPSHFRVVHTYPVLIRIRATILCRPTRRCHAPTDTSPKGLLPVLLRTILAPDRRNSPRRGGCILKLTPIAF